MSVNISINREAWRSRLAVYSKLLLRWGWFVLLSIILTTICSSLIPDISSVNNYQATLQIQVQLPTGQGSTANKNLATTFFSNFFVSPDTLSMAFARLHTMRQFHDLSLSEMQVLVTATPVLNSNVVQLTAQSNTPYNATIIVNDVYQTILQKVHDKRSFVNDGLNAALVAELNEVQADLANSQAVLQNLSATSKVASSQYLFLSSLSREQQQQVNTLNTLLSALSHQKLGNSDFLGLASSTPGITTVPGTGPTQEQRLALSPLVGLIMGLGGILLASRFSNRLPLPGKKREVILPHLMASVPVLPQLKENRLRVLKQTAPQSLSLLRRVHYQISEHGKRLQLITVTSPNGREGKSTIAASLAIAAAQSGLHTLLVDANPTRPVLHTWFQLLNTANPLHTVHSLASGVLQPSALFSNTSVPKLSLLILGNANQIGTAKTLPETIRIDELVSFTKLLCSQADLVIFDGPALPNDANTAKLAILSDIVLVVVDARRSKSTHILEAEALLSEMRATFAIVLNRARLNS